MVLEEKDYDKIRDELDNCKKPLFYFDDDPDGLCSFLLLYRYVGDGKGVCVKSKPVVDEKFSKKVDEFLPDKVFVLDKPYVDQDFLDRIKVPVIWIDHHEPIERERVKYFNPRTKGEHTPVTYVCYKVSQKDIWIGMIGCIGDWFMPDFKDEFVKLYPDYMDAKITKPEDALFTTKLGLLVKIFSFCLKGRTTEVKRCFKTLTRVKHPDEILNQTSSQGKFIFKRYKSVDDLFQPILAEARAAAKKSKDKIILYHYTETKMSFSAELSNLLLYENPDKLIMVAREKTDDVVLSLRSSKLRVDKILEKALVGVKGYGGGHPYACGACIDKEFFKQFVENIRSQL